MKGVIIDEFHQKMIGAEGLEIRIYSIVEANGGQLYRGDKYENRGIGDLYEFCDTRRISEVDQSFNTNLGIFEYIKEPRNRIIW